MTIAVVLKKNINDDYNDFEEEKNEYCDSLHYIGLVAVWP